MRIPRIAAVLLFVAPLASFGCSKRDGGGADVWSNAAIKKAKDRGKLIVLTEAKFFPFEYRDPDGQFQGFDLDLCREFAKDAKIDVEFRDESFEALSGELERGLGDLLISGMTITGLRGFNVSFTQPYFLTRTLTLLAKPGADAVTKVDDLNDAARRIVAKLGTTGEIAARRRCPKAKIDTLNEDTLCALEVAQGRADAFIYDEMQIRQYAADHPKSARVLEEVVTIEPYGIACKKGDVETVAWLNVELDLLRRDGRLDALYAKHFPGIAPPK